MKKGLDAVISIMSAEALMIITLWNDLISFGFASFRSAFLGFAAALGGLLGKEIYNYYKDKYEKNKR